LEYTVGVEEHSVTIRDVKQEIFVLLSIIWGFISQKQIMSLVNCKQKTKHSLKRSKTIRVLNLQINPLRGGRWIY